MNERIKELARQAGVDFGSVTQDYFGEWFPAITSTEKIDFEKFAELIVRECAELIDNKVMITAAQTYDEVFVAVYDTNFANSKRIREHFGVEE
jgi:hypothetical protein